MTMRMASARGGGRYLFERLSLRLPLLHWQHRLHLCRFGGVALAEIVIRCGSRKIVFFASCVPDAASSERSGAPLRTHTAYNKSGFARRPPEPSKKRTRASI